MITGSFQLAGRKSQRNPILCTKPTASATTTTASAETSSNSAKRPLTKTANTLQRNVPTAISSPLGTYCPYTTAQTNHGYAISAKQRFPRVTSRNISMSVRVALSSVLSAASTSRTATSNTMRVHVGGQDRRKNRIWKLMWMQTYCERNWNPRA